MESRSNLVMLIVVGVLTCSNLGKTDNKTTPDFPTNDSPASGQEEITTSSYAKEVSSLSSTPITPSTAADTTATSPSSTTISTVITAGTQSTTSSTGKTITMSTTGPLETTSTSMTTSATTATPSPTTTAGAATLCPGVEESFFGKYGLITFIVALGVILLLLYTVIMLLLLPRILNRSRKGGKYTVSKSGRKSEDHKEIAPLAIGDDEDTQSSSKAIDPGPLMLVTAMDSSVLVSGQDDDDGDDQNGPLNPNTEDTRKGSTDQGNVSTFLLRQTSIRQAEEKRRAEAEVQEKTNIAGTVNGVSDTRESVTTGNTSEIAGNDNTCDDLLSSVVNSPMYELNNEITEV